MKSRGSSAPIVTEIRPGEPGFDSQQEQGFFFFSPRRPDRLWDSSTRPSSYPVGTGGSFTVGKADMAWSLQLTSI
jgi:hypothetical protein